MNWDDYPPEQKILIVCTYLLTCVMALPHSIVNQSSGYEWICATIIVVLGLVKLNIK